MPDQDCKIILSKLNGTQVFRRKETHFAIGCNDRLNQNSVAPKFEHMQSYNPEP